jgi:hypothetical protein
MKQVQVFELFFLKNNVFIFVKLRQYSQKKYFASAS